MFFVVFLYFKNHKKIHQKNNIAVMKSYGWLCDLFVEIKYEMKSSLFHVTYEIYVE